MRKARPDQDRDNSPQGIQRRAEYGRQSIRHEADIVAGDVGPLMAVASLLGVSIELCQANGIPRSQLVAMLVDVLHSLHHPEQAR